MGPLRNSKSKPKPKHTRKLSTSRLQRTRRSSLSSTQTQIQQVQRQQLKKQKQKQHHQQQRALVAFAAQRARRERWAIIAKDTQRIVCGDGKYVEERPSTSGFYSGDTSTSSFSSQPSSVYFSSAHAPRPSKGRQDHSQGQPQGQGTIHVVHDIAPHIQLSKQLSTFYPHTSPSLAEWRRRPNARSVETSFTFTSSSTLTAARTLHTTYPHLTNTSAYSLPTTTIGVLAFSSPKRPGGGYLHGGDEQEEALARSTSLVACLDTEQGKAFYKTHKAFSGVDGKGIYDHSMVYCPGVVAFRKEDDDTLDNAPSISSAPTNVRPRSKSRSKSKSQPSPTLALTPASTSTSSSNPTPQTETTIPPYPLNILSSTPPSYAAIHQTYTITPSTSHIFTSGIKSVLTQRLGRVLRTFEERGDTAIVLGAYGCGSSEVQVDMIASVWAELLVCGEEEEAEGEGRSSNTVNGMQGGRGRWRREARFKDVFERVVFAVPGKLFAPFKEGFEMRVLEAQINDASRA